MKAVGGDSFAARVTGEARTFRHPRSPLERAVNRLLYVLVALVLGLGALLAFSLYHRHVHLHTAVATSTAGVVSMIPEGLMVLVSLTYAAGALRMSRRGVLAQQLNAIESLASVDTICIDKTGTLTGAALRVVEVLPAPGTGEDQLRAALGEFAASAAARNATLQAIADACPGAQQPVRGEVAVLQPTSLECGLLRRAARSTWVLPAGFRSARSLPRAPSASARAGACWRLPAERGRCAQPPAEQPPADLEPLGAVVLAEELRPNVRDTIAFLKREGVEIKVLSGDSPQTVAAIARDVGIEVGGVSEGDAIPGDPQARRAYAADTTVVGRISPEGKQAIVEALRDDGRYVAMVGDGVNDVPALKSARLAIAQGSGTQMARSVADLVLISGDFASVPALLAEGRRALRNLQRVSRLYITKSAFAAFLILTIGISSDSYPLLPRHLTLAASLTIGIPTFFLALAPSSGPWAPERFARRVARFAVPAGAVLGAGVVAGYLFALHDLDLSVADARTVAVTILVAAGLYLVMALETEGSWRRSSLVAGMCATLAGVYAAALLLPGTRRFFELTTPDPGMIATSVIAAAVTIAALALCGFSIGASDTPSGGASS